MMKCKKENDARRRVELLLLRCAPVVPIRLRLRSGGRKEGDAPSSPVHSRRSMRMNDQEAAHCSDCIQATRRAGIGKLHAVCYSILTSAGKDEARINTHRKQFILHVTETSARIGLLHHAA